MKASYAHYTLHFRQPAGTSRGVLTEKETYFLKLEDEDMPGVFGLGECAVFRGLSADDVPTYEDKLRELCANISADKETDLHEFPSIRFDSKRQSTTLQTDAAASRSRPTSPKECRRYPSMDWCGWEQRRRCCTASTTKSRQGSQR